MRLVDLANEVGPDVEGHLPEAATTVLTHLIGQSMVKNDLDFADRDVAVSTVFAICLAGTILVDGLEKSGHQVQPASMFALATRRLLADIHPDDAERKRIFLEGVAEFQAVAAGKRDDWKKLTDGVCQATVGAVFAADPRYVDMLAPLIGPLHTERVKLTNAA
ncbi:hypothetical protein CKO28_05995 [Rhodovibrio sodomensis]|uniref:Uncharacterized protein n=2 Tax=Rhodovibrio sodomensis TaxID=1088 RepID=A0ABS1DCW1_9PROT|nr:hypothetical protein [Rhodovibrio sodomensis]